MMNNLSPIQQFANDVNAAAPLVEAPEQGSAAWDVVEGAEVKEYYSKSPYATISAHKKGFVVHNLVTGGQHPIAGWDGACTLRQRLSTRYQIIQAGGRF